MPRLTRTAAALAAAAVLVLTAACGPDDPTPTSSTTTSTTTTSTPSTTTTTESAEARDARLAGESIAAYWVVLDRLASNPNESLNALATVSRDTARDQWSRILTLRRGQGITQTGATVVDMPAARKNKAGQWDATACIDVTKVNLVDKDGKSVVKANRPPRVKYAYVIQKDKGSFYILEDKAVGVC